MSQPLYTKHLELSLKHCSTNCI